MKEGHSLLAAEELGQVEKGLAQPPPQQPGPHGGAGKVQGGEQGQTFTAPPAALEELQVASRLEIKGHKGRSGIGGEGGQVGQEGPLGIGQVLHDGPGRAHRQGKPIAAKGLQADYAKLGE